MKKLARFNSQLEAHLITQALNAQGIKAEMKGFKEYTSIVLGTDQGSYDVFVNERYYDEALAYVKGLETANAQATTTIHSPQNHFKKAVIYSFMAVFILPLVCNYVSLLNLRLYLKLEKRRSRQIGASVLILLLQIPTYFTLHFIFSKL